MKVSITGASGLLGRHLVPYLEAHNATVHRYVRTKEEGAYFWNPANGEIDLSGLEDCDALIHLSGENVASGRWTDSRRRRLYASRVDSTRFLVESMAKLKLKPRVFICASAVGYYGDRGNQTLTEDSGAGDGLLARVCQDWETAAQAAEAHGCRVIRLRLGVVLSEEGGALKAMLRPFRWGLGGPLGTGHQWVSWVSIEDVTRSIWYMINDPIIRGPINVTAPYPVTNEELSQALAHNLRKPAFLRVPAFILRLLLGDMADEMLLSSTRAIPKVLEERGFIFNHPKIREALHNLLNKK